MKERNEIEKIYKWDLSVIFNSDNELYAELNELKGYLSKLVTYKGTLSNKQKCLEFFKLNSMLSLRLNKVGVYAFLKHSENLENNKYVEMISVINDVQHKFSLATAFEVSELSNLKTEYIIELISNPDFKNYAFSLIEIIRNKPHILSEEEELIVTKTGKFAGGFSDVFDNIDSIDITFEDAIDSKNKKHELNTSNFRLLLESKDRLLRKNAFEKYYNGFLKLQNTIATNYINSVKADCVYSDIYKHSSCLSSALFGGNISEKVYTKLVSSVNNNLGLMHKYYGIRKKLLKLKDLEYYDIYNDIVDIKTTYDYLKATDIIFKALAPLGDEYLSLLKRSISERWIDVFPNKNKETGAYSVGLFSVHPYVLLNTVNNLDSVFTMAHELGHALHSYYSDTNQPYELSDYPIFLAEIASTTNEVLLNKWFINNAKTKNEKIFFLNKYINIFRTTLFRQTMFSEFEEFSHRTIENGEPISKDILSSFYEKLNKKYHGTNLNNCNEIAFEWLRIPHFYRSFYVYKYATGITSAIVLANKILSNEKNAVENYLHFLKSGGSDYPIEILKRTGVNLETDEPYNIAFKELSDALDELQKLTK